MLSLIGIGIISLVLYIAIILVLMTGFKRRASESMLWAYLIIVMIAGVFSKHTVTNVFT